jgi:hypothetical protein
MSARKKSPPIPTSLAADGNRGAGVNTRGAHGRECNPDAPAILLLASVAIQTATAYLDRYARQTDAPPAGVVEAADCLEAAARSLAMAVTP